MKDTQNEPQLSAEMEIHKKVIQGMENIGYKLLNDGKTFYQVGMELEPRTGITFSMTQAYVIATALEEQRVILQKVVSQQLLSTSLTARECEKIMNAVFPNGKE